jgi:galactokinase
VRAQDALPPPVESARLGFANRYGHAPAATAFAPGRVNLIGDHTDYQGGLALPLAIDMGIAVACSPAADGRWHLESAGWESAPALDPAQVEPHAPLSGPPWITLLAALLTEAGLRRGLEVFVTGDLPAGVGVSSSAAVALALGLAAATALGEPRSRSELCLASNRAENAWLHVPSGLMDQLAIAYARRGHAVSVDCQDLSATPVPFDPEADGFRLWLVDPGVRRRLVGSPFETRRREAQEAATWLGVDQLRAFAGDLDRIRTLPPPLDRRARHILTENRRVLLAREAAAAHRWWEVGDLFVESHVSLRDDYESSHPTLDRIQDALLRHDPPFWSRVTGGGFGGSLVVLGPAAAEDDLHEVVAASLAPAPPATIWTVAAADGLRTFP